ncbi:phage tail tape measure protein [Bacillus altitudinis]|uniref:phage tail tape measure protein n=1 Tax=Bacillus altitudinis TaxID=293387 RepID=UPI002B2AC999|nr:phage tail tape measure protein [Bacillus stratosphericus]
MATEGRPIGSLVVNTTLDSTGFDKGVTALRQQLKTAQSATKATAAEFKALDDKLGESKSKVSGLSDQLKIQERIVDSYRQAYEKQVEQYGEGSTQAQKYAQRLNSQITSYRNMQNALRLAQSQVERLERAESEAANSADDLATSHQNVSNDVTAAGKEVSKLSSILKGGFATAAVAGTAAIGALTAAVGTLGAKMTADIQASQGRLRAQLGLTGDEAKRLTGIAKDVWSQGFGENLDDARNGLFQIKQNIRSIADKDLTDVTKKALVLADAFDSEVNEVARAGNNIMKGFGVSVSDAFDLMTYGAQNGLNFSNEMFDNLSEYSTLFGKMGYSAQEYFQLLVNGTKAGVYNLDYVNDVMKEFQIRVKDGSKSTNAAMMDMSKPTQKIWENFLKGKGTVKDVSNAVLKELKGMKDQVDANNIGVALFGTKWEDLEADAMYALGGIDGKIGDVKGKADEAGAALQDNLGTRFKKIGRQALSALEPLGGAAATFLEKAFNIADPIMKQMSSAGNTVKQAMAGIWGILQGEGSAERLEGYGILSQLFPPGVVDMIVSTTDTVKGVIDTIKNSFKSMQPTFQAIGGILMNVFVTMAPIVKQALGGILSFIGQLAAVWGTFWKENGGVITQALQNIWSVVQFVMPAIIAIIKSVWGNIKGVVMGAMQVIQGVIKFFSGLLTGDFGKMWEGIKDVFFGSIKAIWNFVQLSFFGKILGIAKSLGKGLLGIFPKMWSSIVGFFKNGAANTGKMVTWLKDKAVSIATSMKDGMVKRFWDIVDAAKKLPGKIGNGIKNMAWEALKGVKALANKMNDKLSFVVNGVIGGVNWVLGKVGVPKENQIPEWTPPKYAKGTGGHPGGPAILGDGGMQELFITPGGQMGLSPSTDTMMNLPKGTEVLSGPKTKALFDGVPFYKDGTDKGGNFISSLFGKVKDLVLDVSDFITKPSKLLNTLLQKMGITTPSMAGGFGQIVKGSFSFIKDKAVSFIKNKIKDFGFVPGEGGSAAVKKWVAQAIAIKGISPSFSKALETIAMKESGGNPTVVNNWDSNAKAGHPSQGLMQFIPSTFAANKEPGYGNIKNPVHQVLAAINYLNSRYGGINKHPGLVNMRKGGKYIGYDKGGIITRNHTAEVHKGEMILPLRQFRRNRAMQVLAQANRMVGYQPEQPGQGSTNVIVQNDSAEAIKQLENKFDQMIGLLTQIAMKDTTINVEGLNKYNMDLLKNRQRRGGFAT